MRKPNIAIAGKLTALAALAGALCAAADAQPAKPARFTHPREITHPYLPLGTLKQDVLEGKEGGKKNSDRTHGADR